MKLSRKILTLAISTALPMMAYGASAEEIVSKTTTMSDGSTLTVTETTDVNAAAESVKIKYTSYSFDADNNGIIDNDEVISYVTRYADKNKDGYIDSEEYEDGSMTYFADMIAENSDPEKADSYTYWDKDKDGLLDSSEMETLVANKGFYKKWDMNKDGKIDNAEFAKATFNAYDDNKDGMISIDEWADVTM